MCVRIYPPPLAHFANPHSRQKENNQGCVRLLVKAQQISRTNQHNRLIEQLNKAQASKKTRKDGVHYVHEKTRNPQIRIWHFGLSPTTAAQKTRDIRPLVAL